MWVSVASLSLIGEDLDLDVLFARRPRTKWALVLMLSAFSVFITAGSAPHHRGTYFLLLLIGVLGPFFVHRRLEHPPAGPRTAGGALSVTQWAALWVFAAQVAVTIREFVPSVVFRRLLPDLPAVATLPDSDDQRALPALGLHGQTVVVLPVATSFTPPRPPPGLTDLDAACFALRWPPRQVTMAGSCATTTMTCAQRLR